MALVREYDLIALREIERLDRLPIWRSSTMSYSHEVIDAFSPEYLQIVQQDLHQSQLVRESDRDEHSGRMQRNDIYVCLVFSHQLHLAGLVVPHAHRQISGRRHDDFLPRAHRHAYDAIDVQRLTEHTEFKVLHRHRFRLEQFRYVNLAMFRRHHDRVHGRIDRNVCDLIHVVVVQMNGNFDD